MKTDNLSPKTVKSIYNYSKNDAIKEAIALGILSDELIKHGADLPDGFSPFNLAFLGVKKKENEKKDKEAEEIDGDGQHKYLNG